MMPGIKRKARLLVDWNVQVLFGRDSSELGGLGHPPVLETATSGGTPAEPTDGVPEATAPERALGA
jgi:NADH dehydrogenase